MSLTQLVRSLFLGTALTTLPTVYSCGGEESSKACVSDTECKGDDWICVEGRCAYAGNGAEGEGEEGPSFLFYDDFDSLEAWHNPDDLSVARVENSVLQMHTSYPFLSARKPIYISDVPSTGSLIVESRVKLIVPSGNDLNPPFIEFKVGYCGIRYEDFKVATVCYDVPLPGPAQLSEQLGEPETWQVYTTTYQFMSPSVIQARFFVNGRNVAHFNSGTSAEETLDYNILQCWLSYLGEGPFDETDPGCFFDYIKVFLSESS